ncbi:MAG TPA: glycosyltransferase [Thermoanaerobaculia bacterium]|jgi:glycosyltransferase involved in cell wall biosynthesis
MKPLLYSVLPRPPHPTRDGLAIRNYHLLEALAARFRVRAFSLRDPERAYGGGEFPPGVDAEFVAQAPRRARRAGAALSSLVAGGAYSERLYRSGRLARRVASLARREEPRWIVAHSYHVGPAALASAASGVPVWIDFHNLDSEIWDRTSRTASSATARRFARLQAPRVRALERRLVSAAAGVSCVSPRDAAGLAALRAAAAPLVVPNGVDLARYALRPGAPGGERLLFVGDLSWPPNAEAVRWFAREVWPRVERARPAASAEILGRSAPRDLKRLATPRLSFAGDRADTRPAWLAASVAVVPLLAGGGTRLKILEAAACGVPVVATPIGAEGLAFAPEREIRLREDAGGFADAVVELLADSEAARRQALAARARVEALYDWRRIGEKFARALAESEERKRTRA